MARHPRRSEEQNWTHRVRIAGYGLGRRSPADIVRDATRQPCLRHRGGQRHHRPLRELPRSRGEAGGHPGTRDARHTRPATARSSTSPGPSASRRTPTAARTRWPRIIRTGCSASSLANPPSFTGGAAFWIRKGDEDVWISPYATAWREQYMDARAPDRGDGHRWHLRGHPVLDDPLRWLGRLLGELRRLHRGGLPPEDRPRCPPGREARQLRGSAFPPVDRFPHRDHHRVHAPRSIGTPRPSTRRS